MWRRQCGRSPACRCGWCSPMVTMTTPEALGHSVPVWSIRRTPICSRRRSVGSRSGRGIPWNAAAIGSRCCTFRAIHREASPCWTGNTACCCPGIPSRRRARSICSAPDGTWSGTWRACGSCSLWRGRSGRFCQVTGSVPLRPVYLSRVLEDALALRDGKLSGEPHPTLPCRICMGKWTGFLAE